MNKSVFCLLENKNFVDVVPNTEKFSNFVLGE